VESSPSASAPALARKGETNMDNIHQPNTTTPLQLVLAWGFVGIPLVLGVIQTLINSMQLFR
jgi:hypothetical protein